MEKINWFKSHDRRRKYPGDQEMEAMASAQLNVQQLNPTEEDCSYAMQISTACVFPMVLKTAVELGLLDIIYKAGIGAHLSADEVASKLNTTNPQAPQMVDRILRLLASYSLVTCTLNDDKHGWKQRLYGLKPIAKFFLHGDKEEDDLSLSHCLLMFLDKVFMDSWYALKDAVLHGGIPFNKVHGKDAFEYFSIDLRLNTVFNKAMINQASVVLNAILEKYQGFQDLKSLVDVGGGLGLTLNTIISKYPSIMGINFDLPHVIQHAKSYPGIEHVEGDMFVCVPKGEAIILKGILHDWSDDHCLKILKNCHEALVNGGKVIVIEAVVSEVPETTTAAKFTCQLDLQMMTQHIGGKERTKEEFESFALEVGFKTVGIDLFVCNTCVIEFFK